MNTTPTPTLPSMLGQNVNGHRITSEMFSIEDGSPIVFRFSGAKMIQRDAFTAPEPKPAGLMHRNPMDLLSDPVKKALKDGMRGGSCMPVALGYILNRCPVRVMNALITHQLICPKGVPSWIWRDKGVRPWSGSHDPSRDQLDQLGRFYDSNGDPVMIRFERIKIDSTCSTLNRMAKKYPSSTILVAVSEHALCIENGIIIDAWLKKGRKVEWAFLVHK